MSQPPPFRPPFPPGAPPAGLPPFPPKGFPPPPFPSSFSPGGSASPGGPGFRPPPSGYPPPGHSGLGYPPAGLPPPPHHQQRAQAPNKDVKTTKIFVGSIAPGIKDRTLRELLMACGPLHDLKRVEESTFAFAMFENPEVVLRCIRCLNGVELPDMSPAGMREGRQAKPLVVKADQKTTAFLQEFEDTVGRSEGDEAADAACRQSIAAIVARLTGAQPGGAMKGRSGRLSPINVVVPAHLQDLKEGDLPETQRVAVLDQIAIFRENAARRERDKKHLDDERERFKPGSAKSTGPVGYGYGTRAFPKAAEIPRPETKARPTNGAQREDPQGYSEPVAFVRPQTLEGKGTSERTDEEEEEVRQQRRERDRAIALRERESRVENRERQRVDSALREESIRQQRIETETRARRRLAERLDSWDDDNDDDGQELFTADRSQWRQQRQNQRSREEKDDVEDRRQEDAELKALEAESEEFLQKQMAELAKLENKQRQIGLLSEDAAPIKLALSARAIPEPVEDKKRIPAPAPPALALGDEEDDSAAQKRKRALVRLEYEQSLDEAEEAAQQKARLLAITKQLPSSKSSAFDSVVDWKAVQLVRTKINTFVQEKITDALGELDNDLAEFVMEHVDSRKGPRELLDELSPVLAEEADVFMLHLWRQLLLESRASEQGVSSGTTTV